jgi:hypothetical protein
VRGGNRPFGKLDEATIGEAAQVFTGVRKFDQRRSTTFRVRTFSSIPLYRA